MGWFNKKKETPQKIEIECNHKWKDFSPYLTHDIRYRGNGTYRLYVQVKEPYVCILCKERKDMTLFSGESVYHSKKQAYADLDKFYSERPYIERDRIKIEDAILDFKMVDKEYNDIWENLHKR